jgi:hypothetical protein
MLKLEVDVSDIAQTVQRLEADVLPSIISAIQALAVRTHAHVLETAQNQLGSAREQYVNALGFKQVNESTFVVTLDRSAFWIEDGIPPNTEMIDWLLRQRPGSKSGPKTAKDGSVYRTIPFKQNKAPTGVPKSQIDLQSTIKEELKKRKIPYGKLERNPDGSPKLGLLHSFDIMDKPTKTHQGPGQGWGEIGKVRTGATGIPLLQGVRIYQREIETAKGEKKTIRDIMTFRTVSSKMKGTGRWTHPGLEPKRFLDEGFEWAKKEWERILPTILEKL